MRYVKFFPADFLLGTETLNDAQCALYVRLLCHLWVKGGSVPFEPQKLKFTLHKRPADIRKLVDQLVTLGKLTVDAEGMLHNPRVDLDIAEWQRNEAQTLAKQSANGAQSSHAASQKSEQDLRARTRSPARSLESEEEEESINRKGRSSGSARADEPWDNYLSRKLAEFRQQKEIGHVAEGKQGADVRGNAASGQPAKGQGNTE
jgi:uncharacterized protein YdaU (DUF1376 family)